MIRRTFYCPKCKCMLRAEGGFVPKIGIPFTECPSCGSIIKLRTQEEWITKNPIKKILYFFHIHIIAQGVLLTSPICALNIIYWPILIVAYIGIRAIIRLIVEHDKIEESKQRTSDPEYIELLRQMGYKIYLPKVKKHKETTS